MKGENRVYDLEYISEITIGYINIIKDGQRSDYWMGRHSCEDGQLWT